MQAVRLQECLRARGAAARARLQLATLRFVRGAADEAAVLCRDSLAGAQGAHDADRQQARAAFHAGAFAHCDRALLCAACAALLSPSSV